MAFNVYFKKAEERGISPFELVYKTSSSTSVSVYLDEISNLTVSSDTKLVGRGIYEGKNGNFASDRVDSKVADLMMDAIIASAKYGLEGNKEFYIQKGYKYKKHKCFSPELEKVSSEELIKLALDISKELRNREKRITVTDINISKSSDNQEFMNSNGVHLKEKVNYLVISASVNIKDGDDIESEFKFELVKDLKEFNKDKLIDEICKTAARRIGASPLPSKKYDVVFSPICVSWLLGTLMNQVSSFSVAQHLSLFEGKLNQKVLSSKITVIEDPFAKNPFGGSFDREGMPTKKKVLVKNGVLKTYIYDLEQAKKEGKESTGNAALVGGHIEPELGFISIKPGKKSEEELFAKIKEGIYIDSLEGIGTGLNEQSGDYSLQANGFEIKDGKLGKAVTLITVAGNILKDFNRVIDVASNLTLNYNRCEAPSIAIRRVAISGK